MSTEEKLFLVRKDHKFGFINNRGQIVIDIVFDDARAFSEGLAVASYRGKWGFIDNKGNYIIQPQFDDAYWFSNGLSVVKMWGLSGYINPHGNVVIIPQFEGAEEFLDGIARVQPTQRMKYAFINKTGKIILSGYNFLISQYSEGLINCPSSGKWGFIDPSGVFKIKPQYLRARPFYEGKAAVSIKENKSSEPIYGFINLAGEEIIPCSFEGTDIHFSEGYCVVWKKRFGYIDTNGNLIIPYSFYFASHFSDGFAQVQVNKNGRYGYINKSGETIIKPKYFSTDNFHNGLARIWSEPKEGIAPWGYIDKAGNYVWEPTK
jgi:hypothetical protein